MEPQWLTARWLAAIVVAATVGGVVLTLLVNRYLAQSQQQQQQARRRRSRRKRTDTPQPSVSSEPQREQLRADPQQEGLRRRRRQAPRHHQRTDAGAATAQRLQAAGVDTQSTSAEEVRAGLAWLQALGTDAAEDGSVGGEPSPRAGSASTGTTRDAHEWDDARLDGAGGGGGGGGAGAGAGAGGAGAAAAATPVARPTSTPVQEQLVFEGVRADCTPQMEVLENRQSPLPNVLDALQTTLTMLQQCQTAQFRGRNKSAEVCNCVLGRPNGLGDVAWWQEADNIASVAPPDTAQPVIDAISATATTLIQTMVPLIWSS